MRIQTTDGRIFHCYGTISFVSGGYVQFTDYRTSGPMPQVTLPVAEIYSITYE